MQVHIKFSESKEITFNVEATETILSLKRKILDKIIEGTEDPNDQYLKTNYAKEMMLVCRGKYLVFGSLVSNHVYDNDIIFFTYPPGNNLLKERVQRTLLTQKSEKLNYKLDLFCSDVEDVLGELTWIPVVGGAAKMIFGALQLSAALAALVCSAPFLPSKLGQEIFLNSLRHIFHGVMNLLVGAAQAFPIMGPLIHETQCERNTDKTVVNQSHKFFGYKTLEIEPDKECMVCSV